MMELIKRLRVQAHENPVSLGDLLSLCRKAADTIENLQTKNDALRRQIDNLTSAQAVMVKEFDKKLEELAHVKEERDAAVVDLEAAGICDFCGNWVYRDGKTFCGKKGKCEFVWHGPQKNEKRSTSN